MKIRQALLLFVLAVLLGACTSARVPAPKSIDHKAASAPAEIAPAAASQERSVDITTPRRTLDKSQLPDFPSIIGKAQKGLIGPQGTKQEKPTFPEKETQKIVLNFEKAEVAEVTNQLFGDYLKLSYVLDPTLQGRISVYLEGEFTKEELLQMVTRIYAANGISIATRSGVYVIQPIQKSSTSSLPIANTFMLREEGTVKPVIVMYRLRYMDVKQAINTIKFFLTPGRPVTSDNTTNTLIFVEDSENARTIMEVIKALDVNVLQEVSMEIVQLQSISPQDAVQGMEALMGKLDVFKESALNSNVAFIPLQNFGGVLILAQNPEMLKTAKQWLTAFDVQGEGVGEQIHVYFIQNGLARDIGDILNAIFGLGGTGAVGRPEQQIVGATGGRSSTGFGRGFGSGTSGSGFGSSTTGAGGSFGASGSTSSQSRGTFGGGSSGSFGSTGAGGARGVGTTTGYGLGTRAGGSLQTFSPSTALTGEVIIIPDETNNALVVRANATDYAKIKQTVETLDILPRAVLIEVMIAEVTLNKNLQYGIRWFFRDGDFRTGFNGQTLTGKTTDADGNLVDPNPDDDDKLSDLILANFVSPSGFSMFAGKINDLAAFITLLSGKTDVKVLSTPTLLATDNKEASITVGGREPIQTQQVTDLDSTTGTSTNTVINSIQYEETGIILNVTPHINAGGLVRLEIEQTIRNVSQQTAVVSTSPRFDERNIKTTLLAQNGSTVVIGGIIQETQNNSKSGIPYLEDLPILSPLFSTKGKTRNRTELIIAITPHVVDHRGTGPTREFLQKLKQLKKTVEHEKL
ncbi:MAG: type II secretion system secretin GspD [Syntrophobacteraceae bacterium]